MPVIRYVGLLNEAVASIAAVLFFPLAVMFAIERTWLMDSLGMIWLATFAFVMIVGLVRGFVFGRARALVMFAAGGVALFVMWLPELPLKFRLPQVT